MASIASPRPSITLSSRRTSTSTEATERSASTTRAPPASASGSLRRNRAALRDYYGLKPATGTASASQDGSPVPSPVTAVPLEQESELDRDGFDPQQYVADLLAREGLEGVLRTEASLVSEIRGLDGEKKALVYDNYSKLIAATDTIKKMRMNMDPLTPTTSTLTPAVEHIAETAAALKASLREHAAVGNGLDAERAKDKQKQETVRWVLGAPERLDALRKAGREEDARRDWEEVRNLLEKWETVKGVEILKRRCQNVMDDNQT